MTDTLQKTIEAAFDRRADITPATVDAATRAAIEDCIGALDSGRSRIAQQVGADWQVNEWLKKAVLLYFRINDNQVIDAGAVRYYDKVPLKFADQDAAQLKAGGVRVVPSAVARRGAYIAPNVILMPSYVNIGAYVDSGTMVDTWATVGSCAQIGRNVHLSGGVGIGGVLEPLQASPTIIEDDCFIGARSEVVEGVIVGAARCWRWASSSARARASTTAPRARSPMVACRRARSSCRAHCPRPTAPTAWPARSSSSVSTRRPARRPRSTNCCAWPTDARPRRLQPKRPVM